jgi:hypothetical protein
VTDFVKVGVPFDLEIEAVFPVSVISREIVLEV